MHLLTRRRFANLALGLAAQPASSIGAVRRRAVSPALQRPLLSVIENGWKAGEQSAVAYVKQLRTGYGLLRGGAGGLSLQAQQQMHAEVSRCTRDPEDVKDLHDHVFFIVWHRAMLYYHERILGALLGNPAFRLPVWDWETTTGKPLPTFLTDRTMEGGLPNPLYRDRDLSGPMPAPADVKDEWLMALEYDSFVDFGGQIWPSKKRGDIFKDMHTTVHNWVGGDLRCLGTSGWDPLFYMHHANLDRIWSDRQRVGRCGPPGAIPDLPEYERDSRGRIRTKIWSRKFTFTDAADTGSGRVSAVTVKKEAGWFLDHEANLGYFYKYPQFSPDLSTGRCVEPVRVQTIYDVGRRSGDPALPEPPEDRLLTGRFGIEWRQPESLKASFRLNGESVELTGVPELPEDCVPASTLPVCGSAGDRNRTLSSRGRLKQGQARALLNLLRNEQDVQEILKNILRVTVHVRGR